MKITSEMLSKSTLLLLKIMKIGPRTVMEINLERECRVL